MIYMNIDSETDARIYKRGVEELKREDQKRRK